MDNKNIKRSNGIFYTEETPFKYKQVEEWLATIPEIYNRQVEMLEPFAGSNNLPRLFHHKLNFLPLQRKFSLEQGSPLL